MSIERCLNEECNQRFEVIEFGHTRPAAHAEPRQVVCPYCGHTSYRKTKGAFIVNRLEGSALQPSTNRSFCSD